MNQILKRGSYGMIFMVIRAETTGLLTELKLDLFTIGDSWHKLVFKTFGFCRSNCRNEGVNQNPGVGSRNWYPDIVIKGAGSGWSGRGRGTHNDATRTPKEQTGGQSWWNTHGRGARVNGKTNYPARTNGQVWTVRKDSGSSQKEVLNRWGDPQSQNYSWDTNNRRW